MATNWTFESGVSGETNAGAGTTATTPTITPNVGDLLVVSWGVKRATTVPTSCAISDTGANTGWTTHPAGLKALGLIAGLMWWRLATLADTGGITITGTPAGGSGANTNHSIECDVYRLASGYAFTAADITAGATVNGTTFSISPAAGSSYSSFTDALAVTAWYGGGNTGRGLAANNTFTGTSAAAQLTIDITANDAYLMNQYVASVQASATAGTNVWKNSWLSSLNVTMFGVTFVYTTAASPSVTSISPNSGSLAGATSVTITGTNLTSATAVNFGPSNPGTITSNTATQIVVTSPSRSKGIVDITVTTASGTSATTGADRFTYGSAGAFFLL